MAMLNRTENDILFDCQIDIIKGHQMIKMHTAVYDFIDDYYNNEGVEINNNFSHDNWKESHRLRRV